MARPLIGDTGSDVYQKSFLVNLQPLVFTNQHKHISLLI